MFIPTILVDSKISPNFNTVGISMISTALLFDAAIGNVQEKAMRDYKAPNNEVVLYSYGIGFLYLFVAMLFSGNILPGLRFCATVSYTGFYSYTRYESKCSLQSKIDRAFNLMI